MLLADPQSLFRQALRELLDREDDFHVIAEAVSRGETVAQSRQTQPSVAIVSTRLADGDGISAVRLIKNGVPECRTLVVADGRDDETLLKAIEAGASGYITKSFPLSELMTTARAIHRGETRVPYTMLGGLLERLMLRRRLEGDAMKLIANLTRRERQVLALLAEGGNKETIARTLVISPETARTHIHNVLSKLGVHSRLEAASIAMRARVLEDLPLHEVPALK
ncbi:MAG TPA: response regulator transcription factor [Rubrobacter sp.]|nr:response regulator transcription factor [Rubrobacter sp.]